MGSAALGNTLPGTHLPRTYLPGTHLTRTHLDGTRRFRSADDPVCGVVFPAAIDLHPARLLELPLVARFPVALHPDELSLFELI